METTPLIIEGIGGLIGKVPVSSSLPINLWISNKRYRLSIKGRESEARYRRSPAGKAADARYYQNKKARRIASGKVPAAKPKKTETEIAERVSAYTHNRSEAIRRLLLASMGGKCTCCGFADWRALQVDHIHGGGCKERSGQNALRYYQDLTTNLQPEKFQLLCANCNAIKKIEGKEFGQDRVQPHTRTEYAEHRRALARANHAVIRSHLLNLMGGQCVQCSFSDPRALQVDHVQGGGAADRKAMNPVNFYRSVIKSPDPEKFQLLCVNCNTIKRHEKREHRQRQQVSEPQILS